MAAWAAARSSSSKPVITSSFARSSRRTASISSSEGATVGRFLYATGFSGHGFLLGPAMGEVLRDLYLGDKPFVDISGFDAERFEGSGVRPELNIV